MVEVMGDGPERTVILHLEVVVKGEWAHQDNGFIRRQIIDLIEGHDPTFTVVRRGGEVL